MKMKISEIKRDDSIQPRATIDEDTVRNYADRMIEGDAFPPVDIFFDGETYRLANGYHRVGAAEIAGLTEIECVVHEGNLREALWFGFGANAKNARQMSNADKHRVVEKILQDDEWSNISQRKIAEHVGVSPEYVSRVKKELVDAGVTIDRSRVTVTTKHGTTATMNTGNIGRRNESTEATEPPDLRNNDFPEDSEIEPDDDYEFDEWSEDNLEDSERDEKPESEVVDTPAEIIAGMVQRYFENLVVDEKPSTAHEVTNSLLKYFRNLSAEYNRRTA